MSEAFPARGLSAAEVELFHKQGFLGPFRAFTPKEMESIRTTIMEDVLETPSPHAAYRTQSRHLDSASVWKLCSAAPIVERLRSLYGENLVVWYSNFFDKAPAKPGQLEEYPWHQDVWHWKLEPNISLSVWLAITPTTRENGCVEVIPGTHTREIPTIQRNDSNLNAWFGGRCADPSQYDESTKVEMLMQPGEFFLFNEGTLHHSNPNRTQQRRLGLSFRVTLPNVKSDKPHPCVILSGAATNQINPIVAPPTTDPNPNDTILHLPTSTDFSPGQPLHGIGWHLAEKYGNGYLRWTGPETTAWLDLGWQGHGDAILTCQIVAAVEPSQIENLTLRVNDRPVTTIAVNNELQARVPAEVLKLRRGTARVSFCMSENRRFCDFVPGSTDNRSLGVAISRVALNEAAPTANRWTRWFRRAA